MGLVIEPNIEKQLPQSVKIGLSKLTEDSQSAFEFEFKKKRKSAFVTFLLAVFFPIQHFLLGRPWLGFFFWFTGGGFFVWYVVEIFLSFKRNGDFNKDLAVKLMRDIKIMHS